MYLIVEWLIVTNWIVCYITTPGIHVTSYFTLKYCPNELPPSTAIANIATGTSLNRNSVAPGRPRCGRSEDNINRVQEFLRNNPRGTSYRRNGFGLPLPIFYLFKILNRSPSPTQMSVLSKLGKTCPLH